MSIHACVWPPHASLSRSHAPYARRGAALAVTVAIMYTWSRAVLDAVPTAELPELAMLAFKFELHHVQVGRSHVCWRGPVCPCARVPARVLSWRAHDRASGACAAAAGRGDAAAGGPRGQGHCVHACAAGRCHRQRRTTRPVRSVGCTFARHSSRRHHAAVSLRSVRPRCMEAILSQGVDTYRGVLPPHVVPEVEGLRRAIELNPLGVSSRAPEQRGRW